MKWWYVMVALGVGLVLAGSAFYFFDNRAHKGRIALCFVGFLVAMVWILVIVNEVVGVLQTFGHIFGLSDAIVGLTIFAMGNSLGDLVANATVAVRSLARGLVSRRLVLKSAHDTANGIPIDGDRSMLWRADAQHIAWDRAFRVLHDCFGGWQTVRRARRSNIDRVWSGSPGDSDRDAHCGAAQLVLDGQADRRVAHHCLLLRAERRDRCRSLVVKGAIRLARCMAQIRVVVTAGN